MHVCQNTICYYRIVLYCFFRQQEIGLQKTSVDEKIGLTLFYRDYGDDVTSAYVGEV
jgi:hypothetical protein